MNFLNAVGSEGNAQQVEDPLWLEGHQLFPTNSYEEPPFDMDAMDMDALFAEIDYLIAASYWLESDYKTAIYDLLNTPLEP